MTQLFKDAFKGKKTETAKAEAAQSFDPKSDAAPEAAPVAKKKAKHGEDGVCCGGCS